MNSRNISTLPGAPIAAGGAAPNTATPESVHNPASLARQVKSSGAIPVLAAPGWRRNLFVASFGAFVTGAGLSLVLPFLPLYIEQLGVGSQAQVVQWAGLAFGATFLLGAIVSPIWGRLADAYGRKPMLLRASLGMAVVRFCRNNVLG